MFLLLFTEITSKVYITIVQGEGISAYALKMSNTTPTSRYFVYFNYRPSFNTISPQKGSILLFLKVTHFQLRILFCAHVLAGGSATSWRTR